MAAQISAVLFFLPGYNEFHSTPTLSSRNVDDRGMASHTWRTQNAKKTKQNKKQYKGSYFKGMTQGAETEHCI